MKWVPAIRRIHLNIKKRKNNTRKELICCLLYAFVVYFVFCLITSPSPFHKIKACVVLCRLAWQWITHRRCCWWVKLRTTAPARPWRRTETPALRSSTWWVHLTFITHTLNIPLPLTNINAFDSSQYECQYCQYHVKAQYKQMSSKRAELQSAFSGKAPNRLKGKGGSLKERLCQDGFHYGGVSSAACASSLWVMLHVVVSLFILGNVVFPTCFWLTSGPRRCRGHNPVQFGSDWNSIYTFTVWSQFVLFTKPGTQCDTGHNH